MVPLAPTVTVSVLDLRRALVVPLAPTVTVSVLDLRRALVVPLASTVTVSVLGGKHISNPDFGAIFYLLFVIDRPHPSDLRTCTHPSTHPSTHPNTHPNTHPSTQPSTHPSTQPNTQPLRSNRASHIRAHNLPDQILTRAILATFKIICCHTKHREQTF